MDAANTGSYNAGRVVGIQGQTILWKHSIEMRKVTLGAIRLPHVRPDLAIVHTPEELIAIRVLR